MVKKFNSIILILNTWHGQVRGPVKQEEGASTPKPKGKKKECVRGTPSMRTLRTMPWTTPPEL